MEFKRARSEEQFLFRKQEIINCAVKIYEEYGFEELNFSRISEITNFTRPTIYKYFATKEEIMLKLVIKYADELIEYVKVETDKLSDANVENVSKIIARAISNAPNFMQYYSILYSILVRNASVKALTEFEKEMEEKKNELGDVISGKIRVINQRHLHDFLIKYLAFASGLYPMYEKNELQKEAQKIAEIQGLSLSFTQTFEPAVYGMLQEITA